MAISNGIRTVAAKPIHTPSTSEESVLHRLENSDIFWYWDGADWLELFPRQYEAIFSQATTANLVEISSRDNIGSTVTPTRNDVGDYELGFSGTPLTVGETIVHATIGHGSTGLSVQASATDNNTVGILITDDAGLPVDLGGTITVTVKVNPA